MKREEGKTCSFEFFFHPISRWQNPAREVEFSGCPSLLLSPSSARALSYMSTLQRPLMKPKGKKACLERMFRRGSISSRMAWCVLLYPHLPSQSFLHFPDPELGLILSLVEHSSCFEPHLEQGSARASFLHCRLSTSSVKRLALTRLSEAVLVFFHCCQNLTFLVSCGTTRPQRRGLLSLLDSLPTAS